MSPEATPGTLPAGAGPNKWGALAAVCAALFVIAINTTAINTAIGAIADQLGLGASTLGWAINAYMLAVAALVTVGGQVGDVFGHRRTFLVGIVVFAVGSILVATSWSGMQLIIGRALQGVSAALLMPATMTIIHQTFPKEQQGMALGIWGAVGSIGFAVGPIYGGLFTDLVSWRWIFGTDVLLLAILALMTITLLRNLPHQQTQVRPDLGGAALLSAGLFLLVLGLERGRAWGWDSSTFIGVLVASAVLLAAFVLAERRIAHPLLHFSLFRERMFVGGSLATFANTVGLIGLLYFFNLYAQSTVLLDYSALKASIVLLPYGLTMFVSAFFAGRVADRVGHQLPVVVGLGVMAVGFFLLTRVTVETAESELWLPTALCGVGVGITFSTTSSAGLFAVPADKAGEASGVINMFRYLGAVFVIAIGTILYLGVGINVLNDRLAKAGIDRMEEARLDQTLSGSETVLKETIARLGADARGSFVAGARHATVAGFIAAMMLVAVTSLIGAALSLWLLMPARAISGPEPPH